MRLFLLPRRLPFIAAWTALAVSFVGPAAALAQLTYVESSQGLIPPTLEGGKTEIEFADIDADGNLDLVSIGDHGSPYINTDQHGIMVWFGDGAGNWSVVMNGSFGYGGVALGDLNGDGLMDAAYGMHHNYASSDFGDQLIEAALGDGSGTSWTPWDDGLATAAEDYGMFGTDLADFDNDGALDLVCNSFGCCNGVRVYGNDGDGSWTHWWSSAGGNSFDGIYCGDINADGLQDFVVAQQYGTVYLGDGAGGFTNADGNLPGTAATRTGVALGDIDNDGDLDLAFRGASASLEVWRWNPSGVWTSAVAGLPASGIAATQLADMDGDGWCDVVGLGNGILRVWLGDGGTSWTLATTMTLPSPGSFKALRAGGDVDHNGRPEIAVITEQGSYPNYQNRFRVFREASAAEVLACHFVSPKGGEQVVAGSVRFVDWAATCPSGDAGTVQLEYSTAGPQGPWEVIALGLANNGRYQWVVPQVGPTTEARLRMRLTTSAGTAEAVTPVPLTIVPSSATAVIDRAEDVRLYVIPNPGRGEVRLSGLPANAGAVRVFNAAGRLVRTLAPGEVRWDGFDEAGRPAPGGVYFLRTSIGTARALRLR